MARIDIQSFNKYYRKNDGNATLARVGHVNAVIDELENKIDTPVNPNNGDVLVYDSNLESWISSAISGGGLEGTQYVFVSANGTPIENAAELQAAYTTAQSMNFSATNRITVIAAPGNYNFSSDFVMNEEYIDLVSLDSNKSIVFNGTGTISITANDVFVKGVDVLTKNFTVADNLNLLKVENCKGGANSFAGNGGIASGTFINCVGGQISFGGNGGTASGTFKDCVATNASFGSLVGTASGTFINCVGGAASFGYTGTASGIFTSCTSDLFSFGAQGTASGTFTNCVAHSASFGDAGTLSGDLYYCRLLQGTFITVSGGGVTVLCIDGNNQVNTQN